MTDEIINQAIQAGVAASQEDAPSAQEPVETNQPVENAAPQEDEVSRGTEDSSDDVVFPRKAINALSRRDKQIGKLRAELQAARAELQKYNEQQAAKAQTSNSPTEEQFDTYGDYLKAVARHEAQQELSQSVKQQQEQQVAEKEQAYFAQREEYTIAKAQEAIQSIPDYKQLLTENADILQSLPPQIERAFLEADEPALAFYALAKEGKLESVFDMSPARAAIEIGKAEVRGAALIKAKPVSKAPPPIEGLKGAGSSQKSLNNMNSAELLKWLNS